MSHGVEVKIDGTSIATEQVREWERRRTRAAIGKMRRMLKVRGAASADPHDLPALREELLRLKLDCPRDALRAALAGQTRVSGLLTRFAVRLAGAKRKLCTVEIQVRHCSAKQLAEGIDDFMYQDTPGNRLGNLRACPDHYLLEPRGRVLEVIETTGGTPLPARFFVHFGDESGLVTRRDPAFAYQSAGTARLEDGTAVGGVRHQIRDTENGARARLMVEFPGNTPSHAIRGHQWHLACEFSNWAREIVSRTGGATD